MKLPNASIVVTTPVFYLAAVALAATFVMPADGYGVPTCGFRILVGRPCFGCGMTRALTSLSHFAFERAWDYHPLSYVLWPLLVFFTVLAVVRPWRRRFLEAIRGERRRTANRLFWGGMAVFVAYGVVRLFAGVG